MFRPPSLLAPQIVPTAANTPAGQPGLLRPSKTRFVTSPRIGYANRPTTGNWRYGDLHPARLRPCRLLLSSIPPNSAPKYPAIRFTRGADFVASLVRTCYGLSGCLPPWSDQTGILPSLRRLVLPGFRRVGHPSRRWV